MQGKDKKDCSCVKVKTGGGDQGGIKGKLSRFDPLHVSKGVDFVSYTRKSQAEKSGQGGGTSGQKDSRGVGFTNYLRTSQ